MAGVVATIVSFFLLVGFAILVVVFFDSDRTEGLTNIIAFAIIGIWIGLYTWLKPKSQTTVIEKLEQQMDEREQNQKDGTEFEKKSDRNSYQ